MDFFCGQVLTQKLKMWLSLWQQLTPNIDGISASGQEQANESDNSDGSVLVR
jgi:hypothetical protein